MNKLVGLVCLTSTIGVVYAQGVPANTAVAGAASVSTTATAAAPTSQAEVKVAPGAVLMAWKGKNMMEADIAAKIDTEKTFNSKNIETDPVARSTREKICRWSGILNVAEPGLYTFSTVGYADRGVEMSFQINGTPIFSMAGRGTGSKNVQLPGPVNVEVVMYTPYQTSDGCSMMIRFKKAGTLSWTTLTPELMMHPVQ